MEMEISFPGGSRVDAAFLGYVVRTDQPGAAGGEGSAPTPFQLFLTSLGTCAGIYLLEFCRQRDIPTDGMRIRQTVETDRAHGMVSRVGLELLLPHGFPERYREAALRAVELCAVKKHLERPPRIEVVARSQEAEPA
jgi:ribosomal protein S12 methylthiotransferase accessory factor